jgi:hypothetical protein
MSVPPQMLPVFHIPMVEPAGVRANPLFIAVVGACGARVFAR